MPLKGEFVLKKSGETSDIISVPKNAEIKPDMPIEPAIPEVVKPVENHVHRKKPNFLSTYVEHPDGVSFEMQGENEEIIVFIRRDLITNFPWVVTAVFLAFLPLLLIPFLPNLLSIISIPSSFQTFAILFYYLALFGYILLNFSLWHFHVSLVTSERIIDIDIHGIVLRDVAEVRIEQIQDVSYSQNGFLRSLFDYGDVTIQTAGTEANVEFDKAPKPAKIVQIISSLIEKEQNKGGQNVAI